MQGCTVVLRQRDQGIGYLAQRVPTRVSWWFYVPPLLVGLAIRLSYTLLATQPPIPPEADQYYYRGQATLLTHGYWWDVPGSVAHGSPGIPGIAHPPLFSAVLAVADELGLHGNDGQRAFLCVIGVIAVIFCGRIGARLAGRTGEVAVAWVAAVWPGMWIYNGAVLSESVTVTLVAATLLAFYRFRERTSGLRAAVVGLMVALCRAHPARTLDPPGRFCTFVASRNFVGAPTVTVRGLHCFCGCPCRALGRAQPARLHPYRDHVRQLRFGDRRARTAVPRIRDRCSVPGMRRAPRPFGRLLVMPQLSTATTATWGSTTPGRTFIGSRQSSRRGSAGPSACGPPRPRR